MAKIRISLDTRRKRNDQTYPLIFRLSHQGNSTSISTGKKLNLKYWDKDGKQIKTSNRSKQNLVRLNNELQKKMLDFFSIIEELEESGIIDTLSLQELKSRILNKPKHECIFEFGKMLIEGLEKSGKIGTARVYEATLKVISRFAQKDEILFVEINYMFLLNLEQWYLSLENSLNGLSVYMRTLRAIYNKAVKAGLAKKKNNPFDHYKVKKGSNKKRAVSIETIKAIINFEPLTKRMEWTKDLWIASFYLRGINLYDLYHLKEENIVDGRIEYIRSKTKKHFSIKITSPLQEILDKYLQMKRYKDYIFYFRTIEDEKKAYEQYVNYRAIYNKTLKKIGDLIGSEIPLSSYAVRHSFATIAKNSGVPISVISESLGHRSTEITEAYLKSFEHDVLDRETDKVYEQLND